jgi:acetone carboxylase gamma subunit
MIKYIGITYPKILANKLVWWLWRRFMCPNNKHLLDECASLDDWYLSCDACGLEVHINQVNREYYK